MGSCGCGECVGQYKFPGPNNTWYTLEIYRPCNYCKTPLGTIIRHFSGEDIEMFDIENLPDLDFDKELNDSYIKILDTKALEKSMIENLVYEDGPVKEVCDVEDVSEDILKRALELTEE